MMALRAATAASNHGIESQVWAENIHLQELSK